MLNEEIIEALSKENGIAKEDIQTILGGYYRLLMKDKMAGCEPVTDSIPHPTAEGDITDN